jgi:hypothetical protein
MFQEGERRIKLSENRPLAVRLHNFASASVPARPRRRTSAGWRIRLGAGPSVRLWRPDSRHRINATLAAKLASTNVTKISGRSSERAAKTADNAKLGMTLVEFVQTANGLPDPDPGVRER